ncbi:hypothetical protein AGLY_015433 [Aphis glycines]|uniref:Uncharacterized protein n=1 Tax=Aphis glycines TaxID=307491 RepID=A0A6G0T1B0_APHGL|nr:hypothetical protein AGLY_015433 [Aphis glycines]
MVMLENIINELHRPARKIFPRRTVITGSKDNLWQADLLDVQSHYKQNYGFKYILVVESLKNKTGKKMHKRIKLSSINLNRLKLLQPCINANIIEFADKLVMYQTCDVLYLTPECIRSDYISSYIKDYNFKMEDMKDDGKSFLFELQQIHHVKFVGIVLKRDITNQKTKITMK